MDYYEIGQRIRRIRKAHKLSQEELAEKVGISTTHMSHIETGNTKLSLPVFVDIAEALEVKTDSLLYDEPRDSVTTAMSDIAAILEECDNAFYEYKDNLNELNYIFVMKNREHFC